LQNNTGRLRAQAGRQAKHVGAADALSGSLLEGVPVEGAGDIVFLIAVDIEGLEIDGQ
jgi:hypothetical protein